MLVQILHVNSSGLHAVDVIMDHIPLVLDLVTSLRIRAWLHGAAVVFLVGRDGLIVEPPSFGHVCSLLADSCMQVFLRDSLALLVVVGIAGL